MPSSLARVRVVSASEAAARDRAAINRGISTSVLMQRAGTAAANEILRRYRDRIADGALVFTGPGNNGGDGWVVAGHLANAGLDVRVVEVVPAKSADAIAAKATAIDAVTTAVDLRPAGLIVDAILGTGVSGPPRGEAANAIRRMNADGARGARVIALDVPSGLDATTGEHTECVVAELTLTFDAVKRGCLLARDFCGEIAVLDIGLDDANPPAESSLPWLVDKELTDSKIPPIPFDAHKGGRKHLAVVGGGKGMPGAVVLATRAALRSGIGLVRVLVDEENVGAVLNAAPSALIATWPEAPDQIEESISRWADALVIGPGLGKSPATRELVARILAASDVPVLLDADALNVFDGDLSALGKLLRGRPALITPHPAEFARLAGTDVRTVLANRFDIGLELARTLECVVLLKGAPTIIFAPGGERFVSARGSAALGTGGSGDLLAGIAGTLLAQTGDPIAAAFSAAWIHGRAAELCEYVRGTTLEDVLYALPRAWNEKEGPLSPPLSANLPAVAR